MIVQLQVLNYLIDKNDSSFLLENNIDVSFFSDYKNEFLFIQNHLNEYGNIPDKITFVDNFPDFDVIEVQESPKFLLDSLYEDRNKRKLAEVFNQIKNLINANKIDEAMKLYTVASSETLKTTKLDTVDILHDVSRYDKYIERTNNFNKYYVTTGFKELDELIGGWDRNEELVTIAARPGVGKTWILLKTAISAAKQGLRVGIYSGEMSENKVGYRIDTLLSHINNGKIIHGDVSVSADYKEYIDSIDKYVNGTIKVLTPSMLGEYAGVTALRAFIEKDNLDILCVDQHSLLEDDRHAKNPVDRASNISKDLKKLQVLKKIPIISVSQQNRTSTDGGVGTSHIAQSDRISQDSTIVIFLEQKDNVLSLILSKARDAQNGKELKYAIDLNKGIFNYLPDGNNPQDTNDIESLKNEFEYGGGEDVF